MSDIERLMGSAVNACRQAVVTFNNQNSVLMSLALTDRGLNCLLHDNRVFAFDTTSRVETDDGSSSVEQNLILRLLTTAKYRAMSAMYITFHLLDNIFFLSIIVLSIWKGGLQMPTPANIALFSAIGLELFYDIMYQVNKYWILDRLSLFIGFILYGIYAVVIYLKYVHGEYPDKDDLILVIIVVAVRFGAFVVEEMIDIAIDAELHNDLLKLQAMKDRDNKRDNRYNVNNNDYEAIVIEQEEVQPLIGTKAWYNYLNWRSIKGVLYLVDMVKQYLDVSNAVKMPDDINYRGSFFAWSLQSVFDDKVWRYKRFPLWAICLLCGLPCLIALVLFILLAAVCLAAILLLMIITLIITLLCCPSCRPGHIYQTIVSSNFWREITHF